MIKTKADMKPNSAVATQQHGEEEDHEVLSV